MAQSATIYNFDINLSDADRGVYETLAVRAAKQPSEADDYLFTRVLAYCLEYCAGIEFTKGLADGGEPAVWAHDYTGALMLWVEVGMPDADKLHRAAKAAPRVAIYTHRDPVMLKRNLDGRGIHRAGEIPLYTFERGLLSQLTGKLDRRMRFDLTVTERQLYMNIDGASVTGALLEQAIEP